MRLATRGAAAAVLAAASMLVVAGAASAATGELVLRGSGPDVVIKDPARGCSNVAFGFSEITNRTNVYVTVHTGTRCSGFRIVVEPGSTPVGRRSA